MKTRSCQGERPQIARRPRLAMLSQYRVRIGRMPAEALHASVTLGYAPGNDPDDWIMLLTLAPWTAAAPKRKE